MNNNDIPSVQAILASIISGARIDSIAKTEPGEESVTVNVSLVRTVAAGLTRIEVVQSGFNATVPEDAPIQPPQAFIDAAIAAIEDPDLDIDVEDGAFVNTRP